MKSLYLILIGLIISLSSFSQGFTNVSEEQGIDIVNSGPFFGAGVSFYDFDKDGWDDMTFCLKNQEMVFYKNNEGEFEELVSFFNPNKDVKSAVWVDYDNDGDADLMVCVMHSETKLFRNDGDWNFTDVSVEAGIPQVTNARTFGQSWGDYDKDGFLDVYICQVDQLPLESNWLLHNNGDGTFTDVAVDLGVDDAYHLTFQSVWFDYNQDTWPDLHIINEGVGGPNQLFENNGDGTFTNVSEASGTDIGIDAMSNSICDYDNDGDLDLYMTNNPNGNVLFSNNADGTFTDLAAAAGLLYNVFSWGALWIDFDNDLDDDLHVVNNSPAVSYVDAFYENNGDGTFTDIAGDLGLTIDHPVSYSNAKGDFNNDGFYDIALANSSPTTCFLYENDGGSNHYIKLGLEGTVSNRDAVGTWIITYIGTDKYVEYTLCGENYLSQDSQYEIISLGENLMADSIELKWPSGLIEKYYDIEADQTINYLEGSTLSYPIAYDGTLDFCYGDSIVLDAGPGLSYEWSTGDTTQFISVFESGEYSVDLVNLDEFPLSLDPVIIEVYDTPILDTESIDNLCFGDASGSITLSGEGVLDIVSLEWDTGDTTLSINSLTAGLYSYEVIDQNECLSSQTIEIFEPDSACHSAIVEDISCFGFNDGSISLQYCGGTPPYSAVFDGDSLLAGDYIIDIIDENGCSESLIITVSEPDVLTANLNLTDAIDVEATGSATIEISGGTEPYDISWSTGSDEDGIFELDSGDYNVEVTDSNGCTIFMEFTIDLIIGVEDILGNDKIEIYPNPVKETLTISLLQNNKDVQVEMYDLNGKLVLNQLMNGESTQVDCRGLEAGTYIIELKQENDILLKEIIIKR